MGTLGCTPGGGSGSPGSIGGSTPGIIPGGVGIGGITGTCVVGGCTGIGGGGLSSGFIMSDNTIPALET